MKRMAIISAFMVGLALTLTSTWAQAAPSRTFNETFPPVETWTWAENMATTIADYKAAYPGLNFEPYVAQMEMAKTLFHKGDVMATRVAMNRLMDMLENREGGIPAKLADEIFDYCYRVTPAAYHDAWRHLKPPGRNQFGPDEPGFGESGG